MANEKLPPIVCGVKPKICLLVYLSIFGILLLFIIIDISLPEWLHQGTGEEEWHGNITQVFEGDELISEDSYITIGENFCDEADEKDLLNKTIYEALCERFTSLNSAGGILITGTVLGMICFIIVIICLVLTLTSIHCNILTVVCNSIGASIYTTFAVIYLLVSNANNEDNCDKLYTVNIKNSTWEVEIEPACRDSGGNFLIFLVLVVPIASISLCAFGCCCLPIEMRRAAMQADIEMQPVEGMVMGSVEEPVYPQGVDEMQVYGPSTMQPGYPPEEYPPEPQGYPEPVMGYPAPSTYPPAYAGPGVYPGANPGHELYPSLEEPNILPQDVNAEGKQI